MTYTLSSESHVHYPEQLNLDLSIKYDASLSDFVGVGWDSIIDAVRQLHFGLFYQLYLYGSMGTGKTHLLSAICESFRDMGKSAIYLSLRELLTLDPSVLLSVENMDVIAIDDLDLLENHKDWQEAMFHLINRSYEQERILIFASHQAVNQLNFTLRDLVSRLAKSPTFQLPSGQDHATRAAVLATVLRRRNWHFEKTVLDYLLEEGPHRIGSMLEILDKLQPLFSNINRMQVPKAIINDAKKIIDEQTLMFELQDLNPLPLDEELISFY